MLEDSCHVKCTFMLNHKMEGKVFFPRATAAVNTSLRVHTKGVGLRVGEMLHLFFGFNLQLRRNHIL